MALQHLIVPKYHFSCLDLKVVICCNEFSTSVMALFQEGFRVKRCYTNVYAVSMSDSYHDSDTKTFLFTEKLVVAENICYVSAVKSRNWFQIFPDGKRLYNRYQSPAFRPFLQVSCLVLWLLNWWFYIPATRLNNSKATSKKKRDTIWIMFNCKSEPFSLLYIELVYAGHLLRL